MGTPDSVYAKAYGNTVALLAQQKGSRLRNAVTVKTGVVGEETYMDQMSAFTVGSRTLATDRLASTPISTIAFERRKIGMDDYYISKAIDKMDDIRTISDPTSAAVQSGIAGMGRKIDSILIAAMEGTAYTGKVGGTSVALPTAQKIAVASTGLTLSKILGAVEILNANDVDPADERYLVIGSAQMSELLNTTEIKSADYNTMRVLANGVVDSFCGFKIIRSELLTLSGTSRLCYAFTKSGVGLAIGRDVTSRIDELPTNHYAKMLYFSMSMGASRLEEDKVIQIACKE
jgi:hypothetical protein